MSDLNRPVSRLRLGVTLFCIALVGCGDGPSGKRIPAGYAPPDPTPVILVPGAEASTLVTEGGLPVWTANPWKLLEPDPFRRLALPVTPEERRRADPLVPQDIIRALLGKDYYGHLIESLEQRAGSPCVLPAGIDARTRCVLFPWDWRGDFPAAAAALDRLIEGLRRAHGDPALAVDLVAHSAGGLVVRYFIRFGGRNVLDRPPSQVRVDFAGAEKVRRAALIAVPNDGSVLGLRLMMQGHQIGLASLPPELLATLPGAYQVLPHPERPWVVDPQGRTLARDLYDVATWRRLRQSIFDSQVAARVREQPGGMDRLKWLEAFFARGLERGRRFQLALSQPVPRPFAYAIFGGDCQPTPVGYVEERVDGQDHLRFYPDDIAQPRHGVDYERLMYASGDGWVTRGSALGSDTGRAPFAVRNAVFTCAQHSVVASQALIRHNLLGLLALADAGRMEIPMSPEAGERR